jgi:hypothetical protein
MLPMMGVPSMGPPFACRAAMAAIWEFCIATRVGGVRLRQAQAAGGRRAMGKDALGAWWWTRWLRRTSVLQSTRL